MNDTIVVQTRADGVRWTAVQGSAHWLEDGALISCGIFASTGEPDWEANGEIAWGMIDPEVEAQCQAIRAVLQTDAGLPITAAPLQLLAGFRSEADAEAASRAAGIASPEVYVLLGPDGAPYFYGDGGELAGGEHYGRHLRTPSGAVEAVFTHH